MGMPTRPCRPCLQEPSREPLHAIRELQVIAWLPAALDREQRRATEAGSVARARRKIAFGRGESVVK